MDKLNIIIVKEATVTPTMGGCGKHNEQLCGLKQCSFNGTSRDD